MNKPFIYIFVFCMLILDACDVINESDRYIPMEQVTANKCLLLEDYTGQRCVYCPEGAAVADGLKQQYGEKLIVVSMHAGSLSLAPPGLSTAIGEEYNSYFNIEANPTAVIDRKEMSDNYKTDWDLLVSKYIVEESTVDIQLQSLYNPDTREIMIESSVINIKEDKALKMQLWLTESNIIAYQLTPAGHNYSYVHNHVFRDAVNGAWGESISIEMGEEIKYYNNYTLSESWNAEEMHIVGFIYEEDSRYVLQAVEIKLLD